MSQIDANSTCKAVVFDAAGFRFALPLNSIGRIVHRALLQEDPTVKGLLYFENEPLEVVELERLLTSDAAARQCDFRQCDFFVVAQTGKRLAIAAEAPPVMMELPLGAVRNVPSAYLQSLKGLAEQMIMVGEGEATSSVFLLDLQQLGQLAVAA